MSLFDEKYAPALKDIGILPVVCLKNEAELNTFLRSILSSCIRYIEITLRHPFSTQAIQYIKENYPSITVGAGTVNTPEKLYEAIDCGADYCVSPGMLDELLLEADKCGIPFLPGCSTPKSSRRTAPMILRKDVYLFLVELASANDIRPSRCNIKPLR